MSNKTIDGVPRELALRLLLGSGSELHNARKELRALLDAPAGWRPCSPELLESGVDCAVAPRWSSKEWDGHSHWHPAPAAQPQGDPVEIGYIEHSRDIEWDEAAVNNRLIWTMPPDQRHKIPQHYKVMLYVEQPAPVAVRMCDCNQGRLPCRCKP